MCSKVFVKRLVPFFLTMAIGLFIASFFVSVAVPSFRFGDGGRRHREYHQMMEFENQRLKEENVRLKKDLDAKDSFTNLSVTDEVPPMTAPAKVSRR